jgi:protoporphyrinogen oxidase
MSSNRSILVVGAGPTGLGAAWRLHEQAHPSWEVIEARSHPGGLASSVVDAHGFTWDLGGHVLFSHYDYFDRLMDELLPGGWDEHVREAWVWMRNRFIPYPLQNNIWKLPPDDLMACLEGLLAVHGANGHDRPPAHFREWILRSFGAGLADTFMLPYNWKVWAYDPAELGTGWMGERIATVDLARVLRNLVFRRDDTSWGPNATFRFPSRGGTGAIWRALADRLPRERLRLNRRVVRIVTDTRTVELSDGTSRRYDTLISSMPLHLLLGLLADRPELTRLREKFRYSSSHIVGIGFGGRVPEHLATKCWMYFPEPDVPFYRVTVFSNYARHNVPDPGRQWSLMCEVSESRVKPVQAARLVGDVLDGLRRVELLPSGTEIVSRWSTRLEPGYPTPFLGRDAVLDRVDPALRQLGIWSRGRFGAWKYEVSNQDHSLMQGVEAVDHVLTGAEETTYHHPAVVNAAKRAPATTPAAHTRA